MPIRVLIRGVLAFAAGGRLDYARAEDQQHAATPFRGDVLDGRLALRATSCAPASMRLQMERPRAAEFFAGIGLVRQALEDVGFSVVFANDIEETKRDMYAANFDASEFVSGDVRDVCGKDVPDIELATASFPCTDLSLAGNRAGLVGVQSSMFWEFARILDEMGHRRPKTALLENVPSFATSMGALIFTRRLLKKT